MRLYLSSFRLGNKPDELLNLLEGEGRVAVIANACDTSPPDRREAGVLREIEDLAGIGLEAFELDLRNYFGLGPSLRKEIEDCRLLWLRGGNTFVLRRALRQSGADEIILDLLAKDSIVYAGYSAAVAVLSDTLRGTDFVDDPHGVPDGYDSETIWEGLGILPFSFTCHYRSDHPESEMVEKEVQNYIDNHIPFVALRDGQAIVRNGDRQVVVG